MGESPKIAKEKHRRQRGSWNLRATWGNAIVRENDLIVRFEARMAELERLNDLVAALGNRHDLPVKTIFELTLVLEEVFTNVVKYGYPRDADLASSGIDLIMTWKPGEVRVTIEDAGVPFNPLESPKPDVNLPFEDRGIGGLGVHFVLSLMDEVGYERTQDKNRLTMVKRYPENACPSR